jgi:hypothetical protein
VGGQLVLALSDQAEVVTPFTATKRRAPPNVHVPGAPAQGVVPALQTNRVGRDALLKLSPVGGATQWRRRCTCRRSGRPHMPARCFTHRL